MQGSNGSPATTTREHSLFRHARRTHALYHRASDSNRGVFTSAIDTRTLGHAPNSFYSPYTLWHNPITADELKENDTHLTTSMPRKPEKRLTDSTRTLRMLRTLLLRR
ncbi:hypothetical protein C8Q79DRAFT_709571 [Trametes meyenii]|nr:hypothetical protein C8Q79DRAFT_709571 [Trametes meyenii]